MVTAGSCSLGRTYKLRASVNQLSEILLPKFLDTDKMFTAVTRTGRSVNDREFEVISSVGEMHT